MKSLFTKFAGKTLASYSMLRVISYLSFVTFLMLISQAGQSQPYYVDASAEADGDGSLESPFQKIQEGVDEAQPGETVWVYPGEYSEQVTTQRNGSPENPITIRSYISADAPDGAGPGWMPENDADRVWIRREGRGIDIQHSHIVIDGINVDGLWHGNYVLKGDGRIYDPGNSTSKWISGTGGIVRVNGGSNSIVLRNMEVKNNLHHLMRIHGNDVVIENAFIHSAIARVNGSQSPPTGFISANDYFNDAHGIESSGANRFTITKTYIVDVSGDCVQSGRSRWSDFVVENSHFEIRPLPFSVSELGLSAGVWHGEDLYDTKTPNGGVNSDFNSGVTYRNNILNGTRYSRYLNGAVLNLKEGVDNILVEGNRIYDNRLAFRLRQPTTGYVIRNNFFYNNETTIWFAGPIYDVEILNNTFYDNELVIDESGDGAVESLISNNIFAFGSHETDLARPFIQWDHNLFYEVSSTRGQNQIEEDPLFTDAENEDFSLLPGSPAIALGIGARPWDEPFFTVWVTETNAPIFEDKLLEISVSAVNFGGIAGVQTIEFRDIVEELIESHENVALESGERAEFDLELETGVEAEGEFEFIAKSENDILVIHSRVIFAPGLIELVFPGNSSMDIEVTTELSWNSADHIFWYEFQMATDAEFTNIVAENEDRIYNTSITISEPLESLTQYWWRVRGVNLGGAGEWSESRSFTTHLATSISDNSDIPREVTLAQNYPNPFNPSTVIRFGLPEQDQVLLEVYNIMGQRVARLVNETRNAGWHDVTFDASNLSSGIYLLRFRTGNHIQTNRMILIK